MPHVILTVVAAVAAVVANAATDVSTTGVEALVKRRLPQHAGSFQFELVNVSTSASKGNDTYAVSSSEDGKIVVQGNSLSALLSGYVTPSFRHLRCRLHEQGIDVIRGTDCTATSQMSFMSTSGGTLAAAWMLPLSPCRL